MNAFLCSMKKLWLVVVLFSVHTLAAQNVAGLWTGRFTNSNPLLQELPYKYELLLFQETDNITGYSYSTNTAGSYYAVCEIKGKLYDGYMVITEIKTIYQNPAGGEGVLQSHILFLSSENKEATGEWKQTNKRDLRLLQQQGKTFLKKEDDPSRSGLVNVLEKKNRIQVNEETKEVHADSARLASRPKEILQTILIDADSVSIELYDDGLVDGDSVSVFFNDRILLNKVALSDKPIKQTIHLPATKESFLLSMFAENEGTIPPNTGLLIIHEGELKYQIRFSSDTKKSAAIELRKK